MAIRPHQRFGGVACLGRFSTGVTLTDVDGAGDLDLLINILGVGTLCFLNHGHGHFAERAGRRFAQHFSADSMTLGDVDGDGDLDLFVGGLAATGHYPKPPTSLLLRNTEGAFALAQTFAVIGMVRAAVFLDVDADGDPDLLLACEWDSIRLFRNDQGRFTDVTKEWGLAEFKGCWNRIQAGDFDEDGRVDFVASYWGANRRNDSPDGVGTPVHLFWGATDERQRRAIVARFSGQGSRPVAQG